MFLRPQHFQQQSISHDHQQAEIRNLLNRHAWGLQKFHIDQAALRGGQVRLDALELLFRDGTLFQAPQAEPLPLSRNLNEIPQLGVSSTLYACLAQLQPYGGNTQSSEHAASRPTRYRSAHTGIADLFTQALEADITTMELDVRLMVEEENRDGYEAIALACIKKDATGQWSISNEIYPPATTVSAIPELQQSLRRLLDILLVKSQALAGVHRERAKNVMEYGSTDIASFWLLHTVNRNFARINHLIKCEPLHPEELYRTMAEFCGELQTFSSVYTLADIPPYHHEALHDSLPILDKQIRELLDTVISARYAMIPLTSAKPSFHIGHLESDRFLDNVDFYLSIQSEQSSATVIETVPLKFKVGAPDDVDKILNSAMRGVNLSYAAQTPSAIPIRVGNHYFAFEPRGDIYQRMLQSRSICIYVPQSLSDLKIELIAVFR